MKLKYLLLCLFLLKVSLAPIIAQAQDLDQYNKIAQLVALSAISQGIDPKLALFIADQESKMHSDAIGDKNSSFGVFQIHLPAHTDISKEQALNPLFNIWWGVHELSLGHCRIFSTCPNNGT